MNKEPISLYIFRFVTGFGLFFFMAMLYWSSLIIENDIKDTRQEIAQLRNEVDKVRLEVVKKGMCTPTAAVKEDLVVNKQKNEQQRGRNLLEPDPFYDKTLPEMLGDGFKPSGTYYAATFAKPQNLHPFSGWYDVSTLQDFCGIAVSRLKFGIYETMSTNGATWMEEKINPDTHLPEYWIYLRDDIYWEPLEQKFFGDSIQLSDHFLKRHPVTAHDYKFWWDAFMNPRLSELGATSLKTYYGDVDSIEVIDDYTFVVRWKGKEVHVDDGSSKMKLKYTAQQLTGGIRPLASFVYKYFADGTKIIEDDAAEDAYRTSTIWAQNFSQHWAKNVIPSCGAWKFDGMTDQRIVLKRNANFPEPYAALIDTYELSIKSSQETIWQEFKAGNLTSYALQPEKVAEWEAFKKSPIYAQQVAQKMAIHQLDYLFRSFSYVGWNLTKPYFASKKVRQALTMAIDRRRIIQQNMNNMAVEVHGTFFIKSDATDPNITPWPFDPLTAKKVLEEEGWYDSDGDGIIDKEIDGKRVPFSFTLTYYVKNQITKSIVEYISTALKEIGIDCRLDGIDLADLTAKLDDKNFDAYFLAWTLGTPPEDPRQIWHSSGARIKGSSNIVGFANEEADRIIDELDFQFDRAKRIELYHRFDNILHEEQPYTFLYTPKVFALYREALQNVFLPSSKPDLIPGANVSEPQFSIYWLKETK